MTFLIRIFSTAILLFSSSVFAQLLPQQDPVKLQDSATTANTGAVIGVNGYSTVTYQVSGTFVATIVPEASNDGLNFFPLTCSSSDGSISQATSFVNPGLYRCTVLGATVARARISLYTSGSVTVRGTATAGGGSIIGGGGSAPGSALAQLQIRDPTNTNWVNVGRSGEAAGLAHLPMAFVGSGSNVVEPLNSDPSGSEYAVPVRPVVPKLGIAKTALPLVLLDGSNAQLLTDKFGRLVIAPHGMRELETHASATVSTTTETTLLPAAGAGVFLDLTYLKCTNNSSTQVRVDMRDATAGSVVDSWALAANGGGFNLSYTMPFRQTTANNNWTIQLSGAVTDVRCTAQAVKNQ